MDLTSPLTRTAAGLARRAIVPPLTVLDQRVVVPVLGAKSPVHRVLAALAGATAATTSAPRPAPAPPAPAPPPAQRSTPDEPSDERSDRGEATGESTEPGELTEDEQARIERLTDQLLEEQGGETFVGELADDELRRAQARIRAKQIIEEEDDRLGEDDGSNGGS